MPRPPRIMPAGYVYHVLNRACDRQTIFRNPAEYEAFFGLLIRAGARVPMRVCAHNVMPNHWHLLLWPEQDGAVSAYIHWLCTMHALQDRRRRGVTGIGHLYQDRFRSFPVQGERYYYNVVRYIETNAQRAGLVSRAEDWPWSSAADRLAGNRLTVPGPLQLPGNWLGILNSRISPAELSSLRACARSDIPYGTAEWTERTAIEHGLEHRLRPRGRPRRAR